MALKDIESVEQDEKGRIKIAIPHRKDISIPLEPNESTNFISKLKELVLAEKKREIERMLALDKRNLLRRLKALSLELVDYDPNFSCEVCLSVIITAIA